MDPATQIARVVLALGEIQSALARAPASPRTRELKVRATTFGRAVMSFAGRAPRAEQTSALLEGVMELHARVLEGLPPRVATAASIASIASMASTPSMPTAPAMRAAMTSSRASMTGIRASQRPTAKPPPCAVGGVTTPPPSSPPPSRS